MEQRYSNSYGDKANKEPLTATAPDATENIYRKPKRNKKGAVVLALALATGISTSGCGATANTNYSAEAAKAASNPNQAPIASTKTTPATTETAPISKAETIPTVESLEIDASLMSDPEALVKRVDEVFTEWYNAGSNPNNIMDAFRSDDLIIYASKATEPNADLFTKALFTERWKQVPELVELARVMDITNKQTVTAYYATSRPDVTPDDKEPYRRWDSLDKIISSQKNSDKNITIIAEETGYDNSDKNRVGESLKGGIKAGGNSIIVSYNFANINGKVKTLSFSIEHK